MKARAVRIAMLLPLAYLAGCATPTATKPLQHGDPTIHVVNRSSTSIRYLYVVPSNTGSWGRDWLGSGVLGAGQRFRVAPPRDGTCEFDVRVVYSNEQSEERRRQNFCTVNEIAFSGAAQPAASNADFDVVNKSSQTIMNVYVAPARTGRWGADRLPGTISAGNRYKIRMPRDGQCRYDVRVVYQDRSTEEKSGQNLCAISELAFAGAPRPAATSSNPDFAVVPAPASQWGKDRMPGTLAPGARFSVKLPRDGKCQYDVRVVYSDQSSEERRGQNVCALSELAFTGSGRTTSTRRPARQRDTARDEAVERHWVKYLIEIQSQNAFPNWSDLPHNLYLRNRPK